MKTVFKYALGPDRTDLMVPSGAKFLSAAFQGEALCVWALVDTEAKQRMRTLRAVGTGMELPADAKLDFVGTAFHPDAMVFHVFEET